MSDNEKNKDDKKEKNKVDAAENASDDAENNDMAEDKNVDTTKDKNKSIDDDDKKTEEEPSEAHRKNNKNDDEHGIDDDNHSQLSHGTNKSNIKSLLGNKEDVNNQIIIDEVEKARQEGDVVQVITVNENQEEETLKQTNDVIRDIMAEEQKKNTDIIQEHSDKKFSKKTMIKKIPFSLSNLDLYFHIKYQHVNILVRSSIECLVIFVLFMMWPIIGILLLKPGKTYGIVHHLSKEAMPYNPISIFLRNNFFFTIAYIVFVFTGLFTDNILYIMALFFTTFGIPIQGVVAEYLQVIRASRKHLKNSIVAVVMFLIGRVLLYNYQFLMTDRSFSYLFLTSVIWLGIISFILFFESFLMNLLTSELRRKSFKSRIWDTNYKTFVIKKLAAIAEATPHGRHRVNEVIHNLVSEYDTGFFLRHDDLDLTTIDAANSISEGVFGYLEIDELTYESIKKFFPDNHEEVYAYLSGTKVTKEMTKYPPIQYEMFTTLCTDLYQERVDISRSLYDRDNILRKLDYILTAIVVFFSFIILFMLLNVNYTVYLASLGPLTLGFGWIFQDSIKEIYRCFVFLLIQHPFDCGDRINVDNEEFLVLRIDLLYTTCTTINGKIKYLPNAALFLKNVENIRRSDLQAEDMLLIISVETTFVQILKVRDQLIDFAKQHDKDFTGCIYIKNYEHAMGDTMKVIFTIEHTSNFQDIKPRLARRNAFLKEAEAILEKEQISFHHSFQTTD